MLATCSRVEAYAAGADGTGRAELLDRFARRARVPLEELATVVEVRRGSDAARHLLRTAAGLESPVLGEPEILGQLRHAHRGAAAAAATGPALDQLVTRRGARRPARAGRDRAVHGRRSLTSTVVGLARGLVGSPDGRRALVLGRTRTARAAAERLAGDGWAVTSGPITLELASGAAGRLRRRRRVRRRQGPGSQSPDALRGGAVARRHAAARDRPVGPARRRPGRAGSVRRPAVRRRRRGRRRRARARGAADARAGRRGDRRAGAAELRALARHPRARADDQGSARAAAARGDRGTRRVAGRAGRAARHAPAARADRAATRSRRRRRRRAVGPDGAASCSTSATTRRLPRRRDATRHRAARPERWQR